MFSKNLQQYILGAAISVAVFVTLSLVTHITEISDAYRLDNAFSAGGAFIGTTLVALLLHSGMGTFWVTAIYSILLSANIVLLIEYYKKFGFVLRKTSSAGMFGAVIGMLGIGCAACGTLALTAVLSLVGLSWLVLLLPFGGIEVYVLGIVILIISLWRLYRTLNKPMTC